MQAALGSVDLPSGVTEALSSLEMLSNIDANPVLPNGTVFQKTHVKHPRQHQGASLTGTNSVGGGMRSTTAPASAGTRASPQTNTARRAANKMASPPVAGTMQVRPTMVAPRTRVSVNNICYASCGCKILYGLCSVYLPSASDVCRVLP
jgi:hypothetical protein